VTVTFFSRCVNVMGIVKGICDNTVASSDPSALAAQQYVFLLTSLRENRELRAGFFRAKMWKNSGRWKSPRKKEETSAVNSHLVVDTAKVRLPLAKGWKKKEVDVSLK